MLNENMNMRLILISNISKCRANTNLICQHNVATLRHLNLLGLSIWVYLKNNVSFQLAKQNGKLSTGWLISRLQLI